MKTRSEFVPGWRMTFAQKDLYFALLAKAQRVNGWSKVETEAQRQRAHLRAFGTAKSRKEIDHLKEFDAIKAELLALANPADLHGQVRTLRQPRNRLEKKIMVEQAALLAVLEAFLEHGRTVAAPEEIQWADHAAAEHYILSLMAPRFGTEDITQISDLPDPTRREEKSDLECLRDTLDARITALRQRAVASTGRRSEESGWSWHDLRMRAGVPCACAAFCRGKSRDEAKAAKEEVMV